MPWIDTVYGRRWSPGPPTGPTFGDPNAPTAQQQLAGQQATTAGNNTQWGVANQPAAAAAPPAQGLGAEEVNFFETSRRRARTTYGQGSAQNTFQRGQLAQATGRGRADLMKQFDAIRNKLPGGFAGRGLLNSGIYQEKLGQYGTDRLTATNRFEEDATGASNQLTLGQGQLDELYKDAMTDIDGQESARRQAIAASLRGLT